MDTIQQNPHEGREGVLSLIVRLLCPNSTLRIILSPHLMYMDPIERNWTGDCYAKLFDSWEDCRNCAEV